MCLLPPCHTRRMTINLNINRKFEPFVTRHKPLKIIIGGRGSGKSIGVSDIMTGLKMGAEGASVMCLREFQHSISDSVHNVMRESVSERLKFDDWTLQENTIISPAGAKTLYVGAARNPSSLQSTHGFKYSWFEEAQTASERSLDTLIPTIIRTAGAECWFTANPQASGDAFSQRFIVPFQKHLDKDGYYEDDMHMIAVVNWLDNPWWNDAQEQVRAHDFKTMPRAKYDWIWEGKFNDMVENSIILPEWFDAAVDAHKKQEGVFDPVGAKIVSHDPFDDGGDAGAVAIRHGSIIQEVRVKDTGEIDEVCDWATGIARSRNADWFVWDGDGMGTGLKRQVSDAFKGTQTRYHMFRGSLSGKGQDNAEKMYEPMEGDGRASKQYMHTFKNNRAQYYWDLARRFKNTYDFVVKGKYVNPDDMISLNSEGIDDIVGLRSEVCRIPTKPNAQGLIQIMSKEDMKKEGIVSPNQADAIMQSLFNPPSHDKPLKLEFTGWR